MHAIDFNALGSFFDLTEPLLPNFMVIDREIKVYE
jgi:hypothetical protein